MKKRIPHIQNHGKSIRIAVKKESSVYKAEIKKQGSNNKRKIRMLAISKKRWDAPYKSKSFAKARYPIKLYSEKSSIRNGEAIMNTTVIVIRLAFSDANSVEQCCNKCWE